MPDDDPSEQRQRELDHLVATRLADVRGRIIAASEPTTARRSVDVLAVTKTWGIEAVVAAQRAGCTAVGENYAQEVLAKFGAPGAARPADVAVHFIGQLQTNKVRQLAGLVDVYESVDRLSLVVEIAKRAPGAAVLVQVDATGEAGKGGCPLGDVAALVAAARDHGLEVRGLMTVGPTHGGPEAARPVFRAVRGLVDDLELTVCSMGMTDDFEVAVGEGSTEVRLGSALFGRRVR